MKREFLQATVQSLTWDEVNRTAKVLAVRECVHCVGHAHSVFLSLVTLLSLHIFIATPSETWLKEATVTPNGLSSQGIHPSARRSSRRRARRALVSSPNPDKIIVALLAPKSLARVVLIELDELLTFQPRTVDARDSYGTEDYFSSIQQSDR